MLMFQEYLQEREQLSLHEVHAILERGRQWDLSSSLASGGSAFFPHTYLYACGDQIAAVVHGCLDSGADQVLVLGVLHPLDDELRQARGREREGFNMDEEPSHGILKPESRFLKREFSLANFHFLWQKECQRRGIKGPKLILRYPSLVATKPEKLKGIEELIQLSKDSLIVATADLCHHGAAYGMKQEVIKPFGKEAEEYAFTAIKSGFDLLENGKYSEYFNHCYEHLNDSLDTASVLRFLIGPRKAKIHDLRLVDVSMLFEGAPKPSWVAASLVSMEK